MSMCGSEMKGRVITEVCGVDASATLNQHVHDVAPPLATRPVQQTESMVISMET
jgi:hypothetical protein